MTYLKEYQEKLAELRQQKINAEETVAKPTAEKNVWYKHYVDDQLIYYTSDENKNYGIVNGVESDQYFCNPSQKYENGDLVWRVAYGYEISEKLREIATKRGIVPNARVTTLRSDKLYGGTYFLDDGDFYNSASDDGSFSCFTIRTPGLLMIDGVWAKVEK